MTCVKKCFITVVMMLFSISSYSQKDTTQSPDSSIIVNTTTFDYPVSAVDTIHSNIITSTDTNASQKVNWEKYAVDTSRTYLQITTICDSLFAAVGANKISNEDTPVSIREEDYDDNTEYSRYINWKRFWEPRLDEETGKIYGMQRILALKAARVHQ